MMKKRNETYQREVEALDVAMDDPEEDDSNPFQVANDLDENERSSQFRISEGKRDDEFGHSKLESPHVESSDAKGSD